MHTLISIHSINITFSLLIPFILKFTDFDPSMQLEIVFEDSEHDESAGGRDPKGEDQVNQDTAYQNREQQAGFEYYQQPGFYSRAVLL